MRTTTRCAPPVRVWVSPLRATVYLLGELGTAAMSLLSILLLCHPSMRQAWAEWHRQRAGRLLGRPVRTQSIALPRLLYWLGLHVTLGLTGGLATLLCLGNALLVVVTLPLSWAFPDQGGPTTVLDVPVAGWHDVFAGPSLGTIVFTAGCLALPPLATGYARLTLAALSSSRAQRLADRVATLTRTRSDALEAHGAELRRIERDLHDGTQARLVAVAMRLAVARRCLDHDPATVARMLHEATDVTEEAMVELREVLRGIYPPILADRGLQGALRTVAARGGVPVSLDIGELHRIPAAIEAVAYFVVTEALTNVAKHSRATEAGLRVWHAEDVLTVVVTDNGVGGARENGGSGLAGLRGRAQALDGYVTVVSPAGGPTTITVELPCG
ncbi:sensor histidine kinase [Kitasatospora sp. NBC_00240]|uniref:sensor histidine kinase n=1 Tax=Kitasatospora sp. NBC_00240 TaxID=2903567 RepID=UPI0022557A2A|nr:sensor histidine kinase [Kitasatospora sp. NBC_00240]MCX5208773.1 sensor histidine kinase [Kitasatospora sp. NBC_00240]